MGPSSELKSKNKKNICENFDCFVATTDLLRPKKASKKEDLSTITLGYIQNKGIASNSKTKVVMNRLRVLFDSGCSATLVNKKMVRNWVKPPNGIPKLGLLRQNNGVQSNSHYQHSMKIRPSHARHMWMKQTLRHVAMT